MNTFPPPTYKDSSGNLITCAPRRIVCAAIKHGYTGEIICGPRHFDNIMRQLITYSDSWKSAEQGFVDQYGHFWSRESAWIIAVEQGQIFRECGEPGVLYSENLY